MGKVFSHPDDNIDLCWLCHLLEGCHTDGECIEKKIGFDYCDKEKCLNIKTRTIDLYDDRIFDSIENGSLSLTVDGQPADYGKFEYLHLVEYSLCKPTGREVVSELTYSQLAYNCFNKSVLSHMPVYIKKSTQGKWKSVA